MLAPAIKIEPSNAKVDLPFNLYARVVINFFLEYKKGKKAFMVLRMLYPDLQYNVLAYDQDHIHPSINFRNKTLRDMGLTEEELLEWRKMKDQLPNLQMMDGRSNKVKNQSPFKKWLDEKPMNEKESYFEDNYIPINISY